MFLTLKWIGTIVNRPALVAQKDVGVKDARICTAGRKVCYSRSGVLLFCL